MAAANDKLTSERTNDTCARPSGRDCAVSFQRTNERSYLGVTYTTTAQLSSTLNQCDFQFFINISDAYHLSLWASCRGELWPIKRPIITSRVPEQPSEVTWIATMVNSCIPSTCRGTCDKDLSCIVIDGHVFRFAACQFGQKTAGSPLGSIVRAVARFFRSSSPG